MTIIHFLSKYLCICASNIEIYLRVQLVSPERGCPEAEPAPITYSTLQASQLPQINDLLARSFWAGIDGVYTSAARRKIILTAYAVTDSLDYWPERSTVVAMYKKIVVGVAIISSPIQTYITYLAVKAGWDKAQIARCVVPLPTYVYVRAETSEVPRTMLYHLIKMNPTRDFTLHVSTNNSAMVILLLLPGRRMLTVFPLAFSFSITSLDSKQRVSWPTSILRTLTPIHGRPKMLTCFVYDTYDAAFFRG